MERVYMTRDSILSPNKINNIVVLTQNDGASSGTLRTNRWQNRKRLEILEKYQNASAFPSISVAAKCVFAL
ncbi:hypothetical protein GLOIN_2v1770412 [Rhizophagus clarus]|uniref:Uncharacterized protein n=1 Tax=Rhizophagus clarus TaxID=94130 RepID=A0A8H3QGS9_9GLOM|nr:hypothetical protein GLOIN_2v1770412 [Rhizophagus clarus]